MAHPKRKQSKTRTAKRRTHDKAVVPLWHSAPTAVHGISITQYAASAVTTAAVWSSRRLQQSKLHSSHSENLNSLVLGSARYSG